MIRTNEKFDKVNDIEKTFSNWINIDSYVHSIVVKNDQINKYFKNKVHPYKFLRYLFCNTNGGQ